MSERSEASDNTNKPLFQNMDEQERIYAPEQVPGAVVDPEEVDRGGTAASGTLVPTGDLDTDDTLVAGADRDPRTDSVVAVRPAAGSTYPVMVESKPGNEDNTTDSREH